MEEKELLKKIEEYRWLFTDIVNSNLKVNDFKKELLELENIIKLVLDKKTKYPSIIDPSLDVLSEIYYILKQRPQ